MSDIIHLLPDAIANQIAAGEVIQRPASIIKELVENALDAQATEIQIIVKNAGKTSIQIIDNGIGMSETDARLAFERHATSKIASANDLSSLQTLGFRGEALASIAAVAQVELKTKCQEEELGTKIEIEGSTVTNQEKIVTQKGTSLLVKNLFFNIPARRKFLKSNDVEFRHIIKEFERIVLVYPEIEFRLLHNEHLLFDLPATNLKQRILRMNRMASHSFNNQLIAVEADTLLAKIEGYIGEPHAARKKNAVQFLFVNGRYMRHPYFHKAILNCYENLIPQGVMPNYFLYFTVNPSTIDVNVHPTKTEIKFENEALIWKILTSSIKESLGKSNAVPSIDFNSDDAPDIPILEEKKELAPPKVELNKTYNPFQDKKQSNYQPKTPGTEMSAISWEELYKGFEKEKSQENLDATLPDLPIADEQTFIEGGGDKKEIKEVIIDNITTKKAQEEIIIPSKSNTLYQEKKILAEPSLKENEFDKNIIFNEEQEFCNSFISLKGKYLLSIVKSGVMVLDQRQAHIRILFDQYVNYMHAPSVSQQLLFPEQLNCSIQESLALEEILQELSSVGFQITKEEQTRFTVSAVPAGCEKINITEFIHQMITDTLNEQSQIKEKVDTYIALALAKSSAINYGKNLTKEEIQQLMGQLFNCQSPNYTPDGKRIIYLLEHQQIDNFFK